MCSLTRTCLLTRTCSLTRKTLDTPSEREKRSERKGLVQRHFPERGVKERCVRQRLPEGKENACGERLASWRYQSERKERTVRVGHGSGGGGGGRRRRRRRRRREEATGDCVSGAITEHGHVTADCAGVEVCTDHVQSVKSCSCPSSQRRHTAAA